MIRLESLSGDVQLVTPDATQRLDVVAVVARAEIRAPGRWAVLVINEGDAPAVADLHNGADAHTERYILQPGGRDGWGASVVLEGWDGDWGSVGPSEPAPAAVATAVPELIPAPLNLASQADAAGEQQAA